MSDLEAKQDTTGTQPLQNDRSLVAPWWHCGLVVLLIAATSTLGSLHPAKSSMAAHHLANYGVTLAWEWALAGIAYWGIRLRKTPLRRFARRAAARLEGILHRRGRSGALLDFLSHRACRARGLAAPLSSRERPKTNQPARASEPRRGRALDRAQRLRRNLRRICLPRISSTAVQPRDRTAVGRRARLGRCSSAPRMATKESREC